MLVISNDHHSAQLISLDLPPYHRIILWLVNVGTGASRPVLCGGSAGFMNEERGVACLTELRSFLTRPGCTNAATVTWKWAGADQGEAFSLSAPPTSLHSLTFDYWFAAKFSTVRVFHAAGRSQVAGTACCRRSCGPAYLTFLWQTSWPRWTLNSWRNSSSDMFKPLRTPALRFLQVKPSHMSQNLR